MTQKTPQELATEIIVAAISSNTSFNAIDTLNRAEDAETGANNIATAYKIIHQAVLDSLNVEK